MSMESNVSHNHVRKMEGAMDTIRNRLTQDCFCDATDPDKCNPCKDAGKYDELLAYVERVELAIEAGYQMCDGNEYEKFITVWTSCNYRPKWLPEQSEEE